MLIDGVAVEDRRPCFGCMFQSDLLMPWADIRTNPGGVDFETLSWLVRHGYKIAEIERDEQVLYASANVTLLEPGHVIMHAGPTRPSPRFASSGWRSRSCPTVSSLKAGGGVHCSTMEILKDPGPALGDQPAVKS